MLGIARTVTSANRLLEALRVLDDDFRVQTVFTVDDGSPFADGVRETLHAAGARTVSRDQARRTSADLTVTATENADLDGLAGPVVVLPHGVGFHKYVPDTAGTSTRVSGVVPRPRAEPPTMVVSHPDQADQLGRMAPGTPVQVIGDVTLERLIASERMVPRYRFALDVADGQRLVVLTSTWGSTSLWGTLPWLPGELMKSLPYDEYRTALILHPNVWFGHSPWQVRAWLAEALDAGLALVPPHEGWQATVAAADVMVGDHGSVTLFGAALGKPLLLAAFGSEVVPGTAMAHLGNVAARLDPEQNLQQQLDAAKPVEGIRESAFAGPEGSTQKLRQLFYDRMGLPVPGRPARVRAWPDPYPERREPGSFVVCTDLTAPGTVVVRRHAPGGPAEKPEALIHHWAAYDDEPDQDAVANAAVVASRHRRDAHELLRWHPGATCAGVADRVLLRDGTSVSVVVDVPVDPMFPALAVYAMWAAGLPLSGTVRLVVGPRVFKVTLG
ncbi:hypothetical protein [Actinoplanes sp. NPDC026670]|uniref:hypothetical protein n=1 Tax=Actinoplanes sp. NPDC026670 TaxID=3154700 RepID=UPI0033CBE586